MTRKEFLQTSAAAAAGALLVPQTVFGQATENAPIQEISALASPFVLAPLPYAFKALEPAIDAQTMEIHHDKHHAAYITNLNTALANSPLRDKRLGEILAAVSAQDTAIRNHAGGHWNHSLFWALMQPEGKTATKPQGALAAAIEKELGGWDACKAKFAEAAKTRFGSGWAWLSVGADKKLFISSTPNQDNPLMKNLVEGVGTPILGLDVWEHAYYLKYQNRRADYIEAFFNVLNWSVVEKNYAAAISF